jgi:pimeloyl-ACP methyl ester carboxylesterase
MKAARVAVLCAMLLFAISFSAARCYPPGTGVVVFVQGVYTYLDADGTQGTLEEDHRFDAMKAVFRANGYSDHRLLDFSYNGGTTSDEGIWEPALYPCTATDRPTAQSVAVLESMLRDYRRAHPKSHFIVVGHSLGGYIGFLAGARDATRPPGERLEISAVVTLDAPLNGVNADKKLVIDLIPCEKTFLAGADLVADGANPRIGDIRRHQAAAMAQDGVRLATIGNVQDCLYNTVACTGIALADDSETQFIDNAALVQRYDVTTDVLASHDFIVSYAPAIQDVVAFAGRGDR